MSIGDSSHLTSEQLSNLDCGANQELASTTELADSHADGLADHFAKLMSTQALAQRDSTAFRALVADVCRRIHRTISAQALSLERLQEEQAHELVQQLGSHEMQVRLQALRSGDRVLMMHA